MCYQPPCPFWAVQQGVSPALMVRHALGTESSSVQEPNSSPEKYHVAFILPDKITA